jgi:[acyl-carrier-protein] S-malonyltransferase
MNLNPKTTAFVFPGQGSQTVGMGRDLAAVYSAAQRTFEEADSVLGFSLSKLMWEGPAEELNDTVNTQPALYVHSVAAYRVFCELFPEFKPVSVAGHSLGELSALTAAGALAFEDGIKLVRLRGELMKRAGEMSPGGMAAVLNLDIPTLDKVCAEASTEGEIVQVANDNCPGQVVISGAKAAVERAIAGAKAAGAKRAIPLAVSIAAHSPLMAPIQAEFEEAVKATPFHRARTPVTGNVKAEPMTTADQFRTDVVAQLTSRVRWTESVQYLIGQGIQTFVEMGSGVVLLGLIRRIDESVTGLPFGNPADVEALQKAGSTSQ